LLDSLKKALAERALNAEMDYHLGTGEQAGSSRNGYGSKSVRACHAGGMGSAVAITDSGKIEIDVPRDRSGSFDPQLIALRVLPCPRHGAMLVISAGFPASTTAQQPMI
jgi:putative transposase